MAQPRIHLVCNAHIDPVWLWEWPEGAGEALSTFRLAADFCERDAAFVFCHNEALLYRWVEEYEPSLFRRIRRLVRRGRWNILGGWLVQPDCNLPSGESFVRQILSGKRYFQEKFGVDVVTASNLDPFGHTRGLVQILVRSGYRGYLFCRPDQTYGPLPADDFVWVGFDGSEILATRAEAHYNSRGGGARTKVQDWIRNRPGRDLSLVLWGIGNHGGGPSRKDLVDLKDLMASSSGADVFHSTADAYFDELEERRAGLPRVARGINPWATGCYTTMARVKQGHRRLENDLYRAEKMASAASFQGLLPYPQKELDEVSYDLSLAEFHDMLPGSSIEAGEEGTVRLLDHGLEIAARITARTFFALAQGERPGKDGEIPLLVYNPHPWPFKTLIEAEFQEHEPNFDGGFLHPRLFRKGKAVTCQVEKEASNLSIEWRKKIVFEADLAPGQMTRFDIRMEKIPAKPLPSLREEAGTIRFQTADLDFEIGASTGLIEQGRIAGQDVFGAGAGRLLVIEDDADPWGMKVTAFRRTAGAFVLADEALGTELSGVSAGMLPSVRIIEDGPVRSVVEAVFVYKRSSAVLRYFLPKHGREFEIEVRVSWQERDRMLKLSLPTRLSPAAYWGQVAYGREELPADGSEAVAQKWTAVVARDRDLALTIINDGTYGSDYADGEVRISLLRGAAHASDPSGPHNPPVQDRAIPRIDQGNRLFRFRLQAGSRKERLEAVEREALGVGERPYVLPYFPPGEGRKAAPAARLSDPVVVLTAMKKSEDGKALIIRLFEPTGRARTTVLTLPFAGARTRLTLKPFEIKTLLFNLRNKKFREVDLLERPLQD